MHGKFDTQAQQQLSANHYGRFLPASPKVGHALIFRLFGELAAIQFNHPAESMQFRPLQNLESEENDPENLIRAESPGGTPLESTSSLSINVATDAGEETEYKMHRFAVSEQQSNSKQPLPIFNDNAPPELKLSKPVVMHKQWEVECNDYTPRIPSQNKVMGDKSAAQHCKEFLNSYGLYLHPERMKILQKNDVDANADLKLRNFRYEWGHVAAHGLYPQDKNPQAADNLAAMPMHLNTKMMTDGERVVKWLMSHVHGAKAYGDVKFELIPKSQIIDKGHMNFTIRYDNRRITLQQTLNPWQNHVTLPSTTDLCLSTLAAYNLLIGAKPRILGRVNIKSIRLAHLAGMRF